MPRPSVRVPQVRGFLNVLGVWDPSLACVMGSGATISLLAHTYAKRAAGPLLAPTFAYPPACEFGTDGKRPGKLADPRLLGGAVLFGLGWGFMGICPGPSVVGLAGPIAGGMAFADPSAWRFPVFVLGSLMGMEAAEAVLPAEPGPATHMI